MCKVFRWVFWVLFVLKRYVVKEWWIGLVDFYWLGFFFLVFYWIWCVVEVFFDDFVVVLLLKGDLVKG